MRVKDDDRYVISNDHPIALVRNSKLSLRRYWTNKPCRRITLGLMVSTFVALPAVADLTCWPVDQVIAKHAKQGDEIILTYRSWMHDGLSTIIYHDPSDGVVTEVAIHPNGTACIVDVGEELRVQPQRQSTISRGSR